MFDLTNVGFVARLTIGSLDPEKFQSTEAIESAMALLNRALSDSPKGRIIGVEKSFNILNIGEHQVVLQAMIYHVGFPRKPFWYDEAAARQQSLADARHPADVNL